MNLCGVGAIARDIHAQFQLLGSAIDFSARCGENNDVGYSWRTHLIVNRKYDSPALNSANELVMKANVKNNFINNRARNEVPQNEFQKNFEQVRHSGSTFCRQNNAYLRHVAVTNAQDRLGSADTRSELSTIGGWETTKQKGGISSMMQENYNYGVGFAALAALADLSSSLEERVYYCSEGERDELVVMDALIDFYANVLVVKVRAALKSQNGAKDADSDIYHFINVITEYAKVFWRDAALLCKKQEEALESWFIKTAILDLLRGKEEGRRPGRLCSQRRLPRRREFEESYTTTTGGRSDVSELRAMNAKNVDTILRHPALCAEKRLDQISATMKSSMVEMVVNFSQDINNGASSNHPSMRSTPTPTLKTAFESGVRSEDKRHWIASRIQLQSKSSNATSRAMCLGPGRKRSYARWQREARNKTSLILFDSINSLRSPITETCLKRYSSATKPNSALACSVVLKSKRRV